MSASWFYHDGKKLTGPISGAELRQAALQGKIGPKTRVKKGEEGAWHIALKVKGLTFPSEAPSEKLQNLSAQKKPVASQLPPQDPPIPAETTPEPEDNFDVLLESFSDWEIEEDPFPPLPPRRSKSEKSTKKKKQSESRGVHPLVWIMLSVFCTLTVAVPLTLIAIGYIGNTSAEVVQMAQSELASIQGADTVAADDMMIEINPDLIMEIPEEDESTTEFSAEEMQDRDEAKSQKLEDEEAKRKKAVEQAIRNATILQAPPFGENADNFEASMRELTSNEFKFRQGREIIYRSTFSQNNTYSYGLIGASGGRNAVIFPGKYNFNRGIYTVPLHFLYRLEKESKPLNTVYPETVDSFSIIGAIEMDEKTAEKMRKMFDQGILEITVWYRLRNILEASWYKDPRRTDNALIHSISFDAEVISFSF